MSSVNFEALSNFIEGLRNDSDNHVKTEKSFYKGVNGQLYSHNGIVSYSSRKGTTMVYNDPKIKKIIGSWAFDDELIMIVKYLKKEEENNPIPDAETETVEKLIAYNKIITSEDDEITFTLELSLELFTYEIEVEPEGETYGYNQPFSCVDGSGEEIDYSEYYEEIINSSDLKICNLISSSEFENNKLYYDAFISISKNELGVIQGKTIWKGFLNLPINGKICCYGLHENSFYKRIYFTDYENPFRVINIKDSDLQQRKFKEFQAFQSSALLSPIIQGTQTGGQLKSGTVIYTFRLITQNGQVTEFSPFSDSVKILKDISSGTDYRGGDISEITTTMVVVKCNIPDWKSYKEVECIAIEYEALGAPTAIRSLGIKPSSAFVLFNHYGSESEFDKNITLSEILSRLNSWLYCSDLTAEKNKLIASGLRNDPMSNTLLNLQKDFALHSWDELGETHNCLINPKPWKYRYIDPSNTQSMYFIKEKMYEYIKVFGDFKITLKNMLNGSFYETTFVSENKITYVDFTERIFIWLSEIKNDAAFDLGFPNLKFEYLHNRIYFKQIDDTLDTDISNYNFEYSHRQVIEEYQEDIVFSNLTVDPLKLIYGAQSLGFNKNNGIRITYQSVFSPVLNKCTGDYNGSDKLLNLEIPDNVKSFFKGEIYRLGFQVYDKSGFQLFDIPMGDIKIPEIGEVRKYIDDSGTVVIESEFYCNSKVVDTVMYAEKIILKVEVKLSCEIQNEISMYQLTYVERTYNNRTILCQGMSAPMERVNIFADREYIPLPDPVANKWSLPSNGGPTYDSDGLSRYDMDPNHNEEYDAYWRVITNRSLFYFDSPDIIYSRVPADLIKNGSIQRIARLNADHHYMGGRKIFDGIFYSTFSRKVNSNKITGDGNKKSHYVNMSVFKERPGLTNLIEIEKSEELNYGEIIPASAFNLAHEVSNNAMTLARQSWFYSYRARESDPCSAESGSHYELFYSSNYSPGYKTVIIKSKDDVFTNEFIDEERIFINTVGEIKNDIYGDGWANSTHALINIKMNNDESVYGGRSEISYSKNIYVPLSKTIPILKTSTNVQMFKVYGDTYSTIYPRTKNKYNNFGVDKRIMNNHPNCWNDDSKEEEFTRNGAWMYAVILECSFEPKWNHNDAFYRQSTFDFEQIFNESINEAYYQENTLRSFVPKPYRFKDDPEMDNIVAVSDTKMSGDYIDKWTSFKALNFYELEKDKGTAYNLAKALDKVFVIQERQTSVLSLDENVMMNTSDGQVSVQQGSGSPITGHNIISDYGTSIRRAIIEKNQNTKENGGFSFIDENKFEWLNVMNPMFFERNLHLKFKEIFKDDPILDTEGYYDDEYKETNIRLRTKSGLNFIISFNDAMTAFNGYFEIDNDIYMAWDNKIFAPKLEASGEIHELNSGIFLNFFDLQKTMKLGVTVNIQAVSVKVFKAWCGIINTDYPIKKMTIKTNLGQSRIITGDHYRYKIKEGRHSLPLKNRTDWADLRGEWATIEIELESINNKKVDVFSFINFVRQSFQ